MTVHLEKSFLPMPIDSSSRLNNERQLQGLHGRHNWRCDLRADNIIADMLLTINVVTCDDWAREDQDILAIRMSVHKYT